MVEKIEADMASHTAEEGIPGTRTSNRSDLCSMQRLVGRLRSIVPLRESAQRHQAPNTRSQ